jgi:biofilm PGA synthesis N-glycosyltransferase PgaC
MVFEILFWVSLAIVIYIYIGYFVLIWILSRFYPVTEYNTVTEFPNVSIIFSAYNEEKVIAVKVNNFLTLDYPDDKLEILIGSDGSTDKTNAILESVNDPQINVSVFQERHGKNWVLNELVKKCSSEILVFTDANIIFETDAVKQLIRPFQQENIGGVIGHLHLEVPGKKIQDSPEKRYLSIENSLRKLETRIGTTFGLTGAIYAIRRRLFKNLPDTKVVIDDTYVIMSLLKQNYSIVYESRARAKEEIDNNIFEEMKRRIRICAMNLNGIYNFISLLNPLRGYTALGIWSHKILRWISPFPLLMLLLSSLMLIDNHYGYVITISLSIYFLCTTLGILLNILNIRIKFLTYCAYFFVVNLGLFIGFFKFMFRLQKPYWEPPVRPDFQ